MGDHLYTFTDPPNPKHLQQIQWPDTDSWCARRYELDVCAASHIPKGDSKDTPTKAASGQG